MECRKYDHRRTDVGVWHFSKSNGRKVAPCGRKAEVSGSPATGESSSTGNCGVPDEHWRLLWLSGEDNKSGSVSTLSVRGDGKGKDPCGSRSDVRKRSHQYSEDCDCVSCVSTSKEVEIMRTAHDAY